MNKLKAALVVLLLMVAFTSISSADGLFDAGGGFQSGFQRGQQQQQQLEMQRQQTELIRQETEMRRQQTEALKLQNQQRSVQEQNSEVLQNQPKNDVYTELTKLDDLRKKGIITDAEFEIQKKKILNANWKR